VDSELDFKLKEFKIEPQSKEQALANIQKMRSDLGLKKKVSESELQDVLKRAGSLTDEILATREKERV
jgi:hypothetical protein